MPERRNPVKQTLFVCTLLLYLCSCSATLYAHNSTTGTLATSTQQEAIDYIESIKALEPSLHWPSIKPALFLQNLKTSIYQPLSVYAGNSTNFCGYGALTYLFLQDDPLGYAKLLTELYKEGKAIFHGVVLDPSPAVKKAAGRLRFKGILDIRPAEQMWFLVLAGHYKGYVNLFNRRYDPGDENKFWASCNFAKFNRMVRNLLKYKVKAKGADISRPHIDDLYQYISKKLETGIVVLYINNRIVHKKNHVVVKLGIPTHFVVLEKISQQDDVITLVYWDYGHRTLLQLSPAFFKRIVFGITYCTKNTTDAD